MDNHYINHYLVPAINGWGNCWTIDKSTVYAKCFDQIDDLSNLSIQPELSSQQKHTKSELPPVFYVAIIENADTALYRPNQHLRPIHIFNQKQWQEALSLMPSASDFLVWLKFREQYGELSSHELWQRLLDSSVFYQRAWEVEKQLQKFDYLPRVSDPIKASIYKKQDSTSTLKKRLLDCSPLYHRLIARYLNTHPDPVLARLFYMQSLYTQMKIVEFVLSYGTLTDSQKRQGVIAHEHAYHRLGQHFVLIIYGQDDDELNPTSLASNHRPIIAHFLAQLKPKGVANVTLLAFDLSQKTPNGDIDVKMDVFY